MTRQAFIEKYGLSIYLGDHVLFPDNGKIDTRSVIWLATSNLSDAQQFLNFERKFGRDFVSNAVSMASAKINDVKEFLFDWNRVLKAEERHFASYSQRFEEEEMQP